MVSFQGSDRPFGLKAIALYNDTLATGDDDRLAFTNQVLRELSGVNGLLVGDWIKAHADEVIIHNSKYGMQNSKDPSKTETYFNKRYGAEKITNILSLVNEQCLDGEALKSQQKWDETSSRLYWNRHK